MKARAVRMVSRGRLQVVRTHGQAVLQGLVTLRGPVASAPLGRKTGSQLPLPPDPLTWNLQVHKIPRSFRNTAQLEKHCLGYLGYSEDAGQQRPCTHGVHTLGEADLKGNQDNSWLTLNDDCDKCQKGTH